MCIRDRTTNLGQFRRENFKSWAAVIDCPWLEEEDAEVVDAWEEEEHGALYQTDSPFFVAAHVNQYDEHVLHEMDRTTNLGAHRRKNHSSWFAVIDCPWLAEEDAEVVDAWEEEAHGALYQTDSPFFVAAHVNRYDEQALHESDRTTNLGQHRRQTHNSWAAEIESPWLVDDRYAEIVDEYAEQEHGELYLSLIHI